MAMCRSIKTLRRPGESATTGELEAAARQYVRKLSGFREPSARNQAAFETAIADISAATRRLIESVGVPVEDGPDRWTARPTSVPIAQATAVPIAQATAVPTARPTAVPTARPTTRTDAG